MGAEIGGRLSERLSGQWTPTSRTALGVVVPGAIIVFLWAIGGCFGFFGSMGALLLGSFGVGAILVKALNLRSRRCRRRLRAAIPGEQVRRSWRRRRQRQHLRLREALSQVRLRVEPACIRPGHQRGAECNAGCRLTVLDSVPAASAANSGGRRLSSRLIRRSCRRAMWEQADFTRIEGIGPKLSQRLHAANIHTFADLAALPPETLAGILGWTSERLLRAQDPRAGHRNWRGNVRSYG